VILTYVVLDLPESPDVVADPIVEVGSPAPGCVGLEASDLSASRARHQQHFYPQLVLLSASLKPFVERAWSRTETGKVERSDFSGVWDRCYRPQACASQMMGEARAPTEIEFPTFRELSALQQPLK